MAAGLMITRGSYWNLSEIARRFPSNATIAAGDLVNLESGQLEVLSTGDEVLGVAKEAMTSATTAGDVNVTPGLIVVMDNDNDGTTFASTHPGAAFDVTGGTGAQIVDTSTADDTAGGRTGQLRCLEYNPQGVGYDSDTSVGLFMIAECQFGIGA